MTIVDSAIFYVYLMSNLLIGWYFSKRATSADEFMVADRSLGLSVYIATMVATSVGGGTTMGYVGTIYKGGLLLVPSILLFYVLQVIIALSLAERLREFAGYTAPDVLGRTYGRWAQLIGGIESMIYMLGTGPALQALALGTLIRMITGWPIAYGAILAMGIIIAYTYASGMWGVAMTDFMQFIILGIGLAVCTVLALDKVGGWSGIVNSVPADYFSVKTSGKAIVELAFALSLPGLIDGNRYQRFYAAKDKNVARTGYLLAIIPWHLMFTMIFICGFTARVLVTGATGDEIFPALILSTLPTGVRGLIFAALAAAIMSTADSYMLVGATNFSEDVYKKFINPKAADNDMVRVTKWSVLVQGLLGLTLALTVQSIMGVWTLASTAYVGGCFVPMMAALFTRGPKSETASLASMIVGGGSGVYLKLANRTILGQSPIVIGVLLSLIVFVMVQAVMRKTQPIRATS
ncbi:sodium:solute symporter [Gelria sp. Kuro-4]|uniref:sodium:solute symporter family protein n=1 Tax=Gelria sp. Kuro-4 TaxID=2796927 RepID=UPI001BF01DFA|nr:sodium:solute symporter family protein [Gelria sp. Kuro-4]BCV25156.1 solute:Na+ symporter, SSS family protein [Gelria sp. Kuro-4]